MAIPIEGYCVIAQRARIQHLLDNEKLQSPNVTTLADDDLWRCGFMAQNDAARFAKTLEVLGLNISQGPDSDVVLVNEFDLSMEPYCEWLQTARWDKAAIGWLAGTEPRTVTAREGWDPKIGSGLTFRTNTEGLEFVRVDGNVEVYRDKQTGELLYIGHTTPPLKSLYQCAGEIMSKYWRTIGDPPVTGADAAEVARAIEMLDKILPAAGNEWRVAWLHGKAHLALGNMNSAYESFHRAHSIEKNEEAISRELAGICLELGKFEEAVRVAEHAVSLDPDNDELLANLALAHLLAGNIAAAQRTIAAAHKNNPTDSINRRLNKTIDEVATGDRPLPKSLQDLQRQPRAKQPPPPRTPEKKFWEFWKK